ncbi:MAG: hypothetical protein NUV74_18580 [Candidatus Brocadiaceae bacterium]|nr:hypothetical protein [Candidatus Brocadiaceae bacterium]
MENENIIEESETSRKRIFQEILAKHCKNLVKCKYEFYMHGGVYGRCRLIIKEKGFFIGKIITEITSASKYDRLFSSEWNHITICVYNPLYFDNMIEVAKEYSQITGKKASVVRSF